MSFGDPELDEAARSVPPPANDTLPPPVPIEVAHTQFNLHPASRISLPLLDFGPDQSAPHRAAPQYLVPSIPPVPTPDPSFVDLAVDPSFASRPAPPPPPAPVFVAPPPAPSVEERIIAALERAESATPEWLPALLRRTPVEIAYVLAAVCIFWEIGMSVRALRAVGAIVGGLFS